MRTRKLTRDEAIEQAEAARKDVTLLQFALMDAKRGAYDARETFEAFGWHYVMELSRATSACGGIVTLTGQPLDSEQLPTHHVHYLEQYRASMSQTHSAEQLPFRIALDRLYTTRNRLAGYTS